MCSWTADPGNRNWKFFCTKRVSFRQRSDWEVFRLHAGVCKIKQLPSEPFIKFVERLTRAIDLQVKKEGAPEQVLEEMALTNANEECKAAILSLPMELAPTLDDMLQIPLHPDDAPRFAFSIPTLNREAPRKRYHWKYLPQGARNSLLICQWYLSSPLSPVHTAEGEAIILHYMDDVLVCAPNDDLLSHMLDLTINSLVAAGFELQEEKIQRMPPWKYLGLEIGKQTIEPQKLVVKNNIRTLADVQQLCGSLNWSPLVQKNDQATGIGSRIDPESQDRIRELAGCDFECIHIPIEVNSGQITKAMLEHLLHENEALQFALDSYTDASRASHKAVITWKDPQTQQWEKDIAEVKESPQVAELAAVVRAFEKFPESFSLVTDSAYVAGVVSKAEQAVLSEVSNTALFNLLSKLVNLISHREQQFYVMHIRSHTDLPGFIAEGNRRADALAVPVEMAPLPNIFEQAKISHQLFHQNAPGLVHQFHLTQEQAWAIVATFPSCQQNALPTLSAGANPRGLNSCDVWQTDMARIMSFGRQRCVHVSVDTFSGAVYASAHTGEKSSDAMKHLIEAFFFLGIPKSIKTDNGPTYTSKEFRSLLQQWGVEHKTGIPYSPTECYIWALNNRTQPLWGGVKNDFFQSFRYVGTESISISGVTGGSQQLTVLEAEVSLTGNGWKKHTIVTGPEAPCILGIDYLRNGYFKDPKGYRWAFEIAAVETEDIRQLNTLPGLSDDSSAVGLLRVEEQQVPIATATVHRWQYRTDRDSVIPIHELIRKLESQGVVSKARSPFNSPIWPVRKSSGEWRLTVDYRALNEVTPPRSAAVPDMLELQYELESKAAKWYATIDIANAFFSIPLAAECRAQFTFTWKGVQYTWNRLPQGWKHSPTICHGLIQTALEKGEAPEHLQYIDDIIIVSPLYLVTCKKNDFHWGPEQQQAFAQIKQEIAHAVALGPVRTRPEVKNVLYSAAGNNGLSWSLWQKVPGETRGRPLGFWSRSYRGSEANYTPTEKETLAAYEGVQAASEVICTEMQLLLAPQLPVLGWIETLILKN
ncbi:hypothetical protein DUI87_01222 [Hirundo rustica rustica]|uniref:Uncharacterized protein n=1 Tax=Hirundo rustica rustica TaxID=333673 RepID=A0A3M0L507_HIRRU|nr:hypothetical protein DUI87_01222 [Hirundo rustica rustica]